MKYLLVVLLAFASSAQAQSFARDEDGWRYYRHERPRYRPQVKRYRHHVRHRVRADDDSARNRETQRGYATWRAPERDEAYRGWWRPDNGWRDADVQAGPRRCRPPMHAAGGADARIDSARGAAIKAWQEQVINEHGERFLNFEVAYVIDEHCDPARVGEGTIVDLKRCVVTAAPCLAQRDGDRPRGSDEQRQ
jgi:hypothetical protein